VHDTIHGLDAKAFPLELIETNVGQWPTKNTPGQNGDILRPALYVVVTIPLVSLQVRYGKTLHKMGECYEK
jgi:hypothetical protein